MSYSQFVRKGRRIVLVITTTILVSILNTTLSQAQTISPSILEVTQTIGQTTTQTLDITNDKNYDLYLKAHIYKYYPQSEYMTEPQDYETFVRIDTDTIVIPSKSTTTVRYEIVGNESLEPGTYYNLISFEQQASQSNTDDSTVGTTTAISQLVSLNLTNTNTQNATEEYDINVEVIQKGIPFIKPTKIKITFLNNSKYTLIPQGEIKIVKHSEDKEPEYIKVNIDRNRVYPEQSVEYEYELNTWYLEDIFFGKTAYIKIQNGIDTQVINQEVELPNFKNESIYAVIIIVVLIALVRSVKGDLKPNSKSSV